MNVNIAHEMHRRGIDADNYFTLPPEKLNALLGKMPEIHTDSARNAALQHAASEADYITDKGIQAIYYTDNNYPYRLSECNDAPVMIYSYGNMPAAEHMLAIVGTRRCTAYGLSFVESLVGELAASLDSLCIVSGLAYGIDIAAHRAAMKAAVPTGAILAHGLHTIYPADHRNDAKRMVDAGGFLLTEYHSSAPIHRGNFLARNRIVAGMCDAVVVVESDVKGGAMATAHVAGAYNREVFALPGRTTDRTSRGCNELIASLGAAMVRDAGDIIERMNWKTRSREGDQKELNFDITPVQLDILRFINEHADMNVNELSVSMGIAYSHLSSLLFEMEIGGLIKALPGGRYLITVPI